MSRGLSLSISGGVGFGAARAPPVQLDKGLVKGGIAERQERPVTIFTNPELEIRRRIGNLMRLKETGSNDHEIERARERLRMGIRVVDSNDLTMSYRVYKRAQEVLRL